MKSVLARQNSHSVLHVETPSPEYSLQNPNSSSIISAIPETQEIVNNMVNEFSFTEVPSPDTLPVLSPEDKLQSSYNPLASLTSEHIEILNLYNLENLVKQNTCFKNPDKPMLRTTL